MPDTINKGNESALSFEAALKRLDQLVQELDKNEVGLSDSINRYEEGLRLIAHCNEQLDQAKLRIEQVANSGDNGTES